MMRWGHEQAHIVNPVQAIKVRLALRWCVHPDDISDHRTKTLIAKALRERGEEVLGFQR